MTTRRKFLSTAASGIAMSVGATGCAAELGLGPQSYPSLAAPALGTDLSELIQLSGQCLMVGFVGSHSGDAGTTALLDQLAMGQVGNVLLLGRNVETRAQTAELAGLLQAVAGRPILIGIDNEGGAVTRTTGKAGFSEWMTAAAVPEQLGTAETAREYYRIRAGELRQAGVNLNFAPVVDVNVNPASPAIGALGRSFSSDPAVVTTFARACIAGHHDAGLLTCIKHFPGHGSARGDTHEGFVDVTHTWTEAELLPYFELASTDKIDALMLSHVIHAAFTGSGQMPVSLSARAIEFVRSTLRYSGPIVSDDLQMGAIAREMSDDDAAVAALEAGSDLLILANYESPDQDLGLRVNAALVRSVVDGRLRVERLADAARRVASLKLRVE